MTPQEIIDLLSICAGYDQRTVGQGDVEAWRLALEDPRVPNLSFDEAVDAVILHYRDSTDFAKPAHILTRVKAHRAATLAQVMPAKAADTTAAYRDVEGLWRQAHEEAMARRDARRAAVLAHSDLAERLTQPPLNYATPEQWHGGVGPETWKGGQNDSPRRAALLELVAEAERRAQAAG
jgi:hypothetical protein